MNIFIAKKENKAQNLLIISKNYFSLQMRAWKWFAEGLPQIKHLLSGSANKKADNSPCLKMLCDFSGFFNSPN